VRPAPHWFLVAALVYACARNQRAVESSESGGAVAPTVASTAPSNRVPDGGQPIDAGAFVAFPEVRDQAGWRTSSRRGASPNAWIALAQRSEPQPGKAAPLLEDWPESRIAVLEGQDGSVVRVASAQLPAAPIPCDASLGVASRSYVVELDESDLAPLAAQATVPLHVTCDRSWGGAEESDEYLVVYERQGSSLNDVLNVRTTRSEFDRVTQKEKTVHYVVAAERSGTTERPRLCLRESPESPEAAPPTSAKLGRRGPCYDWVGGRYVKGSDSGTSR
jgi:hypothetical protein